MDGLLISFGEDLPSGANLEYEPVFAELERAAQPGEERQMGDEVIEAEEPDDGEIIEKARAVLEQSHDLRAAVLMAAAQARVNGFEGFGQVTSYIRGCLETFWDTCHPQLDEEDDNDPTMRVNAVLGLADDTTVVKAVRNAPMTLSVAFGRVSMRDIMVAAGEVSPAAGAENILDKAAVAAAFKDTDSDALREIFEAASASLDDIKAIDAVFNERIPGQGPDLSLLIKTLMRIVKRLEEETTGTVADPEEGAQNAAPGAPATAPAAVGAGGGGAITSPRDVEVAIDRILKYYATQEPSSPLPILLRRARRLVGADFLTIMKDIAPGGMDNVMLVGGIEEEEDD